MNEKWFNYQMDCEMEVDELFWGVLSWVIALSWRWKEEEEEKKTSFSFFGYDDSGRVKKGLENLEIFDNFFHFFNFFFFTSELNFFHSRFPQKPEIFIKHYNPTAHHPLFYSRLSLSHAKAHISRFSLILMKIPSCESSELQQRKKGSKKAFFNSISSLWFLTAAECDEKIIRHLLPVISALCVSHKHSYCWRRQN